MTISVAAMKTREYTPLRSVSVCHRGAAGVQQVVPSNCLLCRYVCYPKLTPVFPFIIHIRHRTIFLPIGYWSQAYTDIITPLPNALLLFYLRKEKYKTWLFKPLTVRLTMNYLGILLTIPAYCRLLQTTMAYFSLPWTILQQLSDTLQSPLAERRPSKCLRLCLLGVRGKQAAHRPPLFPVNSFVPLYSLT